MMFYIVNIPCKLAVAFNVGKDDLHAFYMYVGVGALFLFVSIVRI